jgi:hypothetical protein
MAGAVELDAELINFVLALPPLAKLTSNEAGAFLRVSQSTLERWRRDGSGPEYIQSGIKGARGTNQAVRYRKQALLDWESAHTIRSSREAAIRKGQM